MTKEKAQQSLQVRNQSRVVRSRGLWGVRETARQDRKAKFNNLLNHVTPELLRASFFDLKKNAVPGIDGETWAEYAENFESRIIDLHSRIHRGTYRAQPSKRTWIPKLDGKLRPLGIAALEDKIVQQAVRVVLECIYEEDFRGFSYGFRPGRSCHRALDALYMGITKQKVNWILDADRLGHTRITSMGLESLRGMTQLKTLDINGTKILDAELCPTLAQMSLVHLQAMDSGFGDECMKSVGWMRKIEKLFVSRTGVSNAGLASLADCRARSTLHVAGTNITDEEIALIEHLPHLSTLDVSDTVVSDRSVNVLENMFQHRSGGCLIICRTRISREGVQQLERALSSCRIVVECE